MEVLREMWIESVLQRVLGDRLKNPSLRTMC